MIKAIGLTLKEVKILIVDDNNNWRKLLEKLLSSVSNFTCLAASSYDEAIKILSTQSIHLAVLDIRLEDVAEFDIGGIEIVKWLINNQIDTKVVMISGYSTPDMHQKIFSEKIVMDFFSKGHFEVSSFVSRILKIVSSTKLRSD